MTGADRVRGPGNPVRVVLDTNVLLALWIFGDETVAPLRNALGARELQPVRSAATDAELAEVLARDSLFSVPADRQAYLLRDWSSTALLVDGIEPAAWRCRDPLDQKFVDLAVSAGAAWLITRDKALLKLNRKSKRAGLGIVTPEVFAGLWGSRLPEAEAAGGMGPHRG